MGVEARAVSLVTHCPGLAGFDYEEYVRRSEERVRRVLGYLEKGCRWGRLVGPRARVLDYGSWLGNVALAVKRRGFEVCACDFYERYGDALWFAAEGLMEAGVPVLETGRLQQEELCRGGFDAVLLLGVIEHVPHTPRVLLEEVTQLLRSGGVLICDTPNAAFLYNRAKLALGGISVMEPIANQYWTEVPFEGHNREYTGPELRWMLEAAGHEVLELEYFNYWLSGDRPWLVDKIGNALMHCVPTMRELVMTVSRKI